jgi:hypothetical protein
MKIFASIMCFFIIAVTVLPSVRAIKKTFGESCNHKSANNEVPYSCEKEKIISNLSFNPLQIVDGNQLFITLTVHLFETSEKGKSNHKKIFIDQFQNKIWQPPKINFIV